MRPKAVTLGMDDISPMVSRIWPRLGGGGKVSGDISFRFQHVRRGRRIAIMFH
jgi:hypothetical protein